ncbi:PRC-barrel domain-containing protein [Cryptosporangium japonicum]|uniref:PRC-barrel domain-containing protein n=1 Tax=Cryptosporangium japonicum TaxID=80872 RepID=A0ABP3D1D0_9ACTN
MATESLATLVRLSDTGQTVTPPEDDVRGKTVRDRDGENIGKIDDLLVDSDEHRVRFLRLEHGGILGFGATHSLVPVEAITRIDDEVRVDRTRDVVADAPSYDPDVTDADYYSGLYGYYGYTPFWGPGLIPPPAGVRNRHP